MAHWPVKRSFLFQVLALTVRRLPRFHFFVRNWLSLHPAPWHLLFCGTRGRGVENGSRPRREAWSAKGVKAADESRRALIQRPGRQGQGESVWPAGPWKLLLTIRAAHFRPDARACERKAGDGQHNTEKSTVASTSPNKQPCTNWLQGR